MIVMKYSPAMAFLAIAAFGQSATRTVYVLPMAGGLDQFLAQWLTMGVGGVDLHVGLLRRILRWKIPR